MAKQAKNAKYASVLINHREDAQSSWKRLVAAPVSSVMNVTVIAIALLLPSFLMVLNANLEAVVDSFRQSARITLYLEPAVSLERAEEVSSNLLQRDDIVEAEYISRQQALADFSRRSGLDSLLGQFSENPLPAAIVLTPASTDLSLVNSLAEQLSALPEVDQLQLDADWIRRADALATALAILARGLGAIFLLGVCFIIGNTIKLGVEHRRDEIRVIKLVGGSYSFIARPFLYTGFYLGGLGGFTALLLLLALLAAVQGPVAAFAGSDSFQRPGLAALLLLILGGALAGWLSALLASWHHIRQIDP